VLADLAREDRLTATLALLVLAAVGWWLARMAMSGARGAVRAAIACAVVPWLVHAVRDDLRFLLVVGARPRRVMTFEYAALVAPGALLVAGAALAGGTAVAALASLLPMLSALLCAGAPPATARRRASRRARPTPRSFALLGRRFELRRGLRTDGVALGLIVAFGLALSAYPAIPALATLAIALLLAQWFGAIDEDWPLVVALGQRPQAFLRTKLGDALAPFTLLALPLAVVTVARTPDAWLAPTIGTTAGGVVVAGSVLLKYARYAPGRRAPTIALVGSLTVIASLVVLPVTAWLLFGWRRHALRTLDAYLGAAPIAPGDQSAP
jgi:hypothetical protein